MNSSNLSCDEVRRQLVFYGYGELSSTVEEEVEAHLETCPDCRLERARNAAFVDALEEREDLADTTLLAACRNDLRLNIAAEIGCSLAATSSA